jgi:hypothetical protein
MFLPSITAVLTARTQATIRHGDYDEPFPATTSILPLTGTTYPSDNTPLPCNATAITISPWPTSHGSRHPYTNASSPGGTHESASHSSPTYKSPPITTAPWNEYWSLHWPSSSLLKSKRNSDIGDPDIDSLPGSISAVVTYYHVHSLQHHHVTSGIKPCTRHAQCACSADIPQLWPTPHFRYADQHDSYHCDGERT